MGRTLFCDDACDECVRHGGAGIARLARPRRHLVVEDAALNASVEEANLWLQQIYKLSVPCGTLAWFDFSGGYRASAYSFGATLPSVTVRMTSKPTRNTMIVGEYRPARSKT